MSIARRVYETLLLAARAHAQWDLEVSRSILASRKRLLLLLVLALPAILVSVGMAADLPLPEILGGKKAYSPAFYTPGIFLVSIAIGLCAGLITGCIGAGGGFIITPALMSAGIKGILAVGTDLFHIFAKAIMGTAVHRKLGNVSVALAVAFLVGSGVGVTGGGVINRWIYELNPVLSDTFISLIYVVLLGFLGIYAMFDFIRLRRAGGGDAHGGAGAEDGGLPQKLQKATIPPMITFDTDLVPGGKRISAWFVGLCGAVVGFMAAIMGVGGGFLTFPMFVYILGVSSFTTVGTDILQIIFTAGYASISQYAIYGFIFYTLAMGMLLGSLLGIQVGALTTKLVPGIYIRGFYATAILAGFTNRLFALPAKLSAMKIMDVSPAVSDLCAQIGNWTFFLCVGVFGAWVIGTFVLKINELREG
ncbi:sulfite exporter TauE/SafE family protein [Salidesulfovibrio onnuriiensis]|uniref:sulfite exporter TauE/SafE family protein n=1 Tax=Salidesulfovibrio onnuriiensis TaxID=2583823 RepID=UPI0011C99A7E|nr:sulfite exporter TauE/SafE family protein [Salidesulfovibrio onnuriiensis]